MNYVVKEIKNHFVKIEIYVHIGKCSYQLHIYDAFDLYDLNLCHNFTLKSTKNENRMWQLHATFVMIKGQFFAIRFKGQLCDLQD